MGKHGHECHECAARDCAVQIPLGMLMCRSCWGRVPKDVQRRVYRAWNDGDIQHDYFEAVRAAQESLL